MYDTHPVSVVKLMHRMFNCEGENLRTEIIGAYQDGKS